MKIARFIPIGFLIAMAAVVLAQTSASAYKGRYARIKVHGKSLV